MLIVKCTACRLFSRHKMTATCTNCGTRVPAKVVTLKSSVQ